MKIEIVLFVIKMKMQKKMEKGIQRSKKNPILDVITRRCMQELLLYTYKISI